MADSQTEHMAPLKGPASEWTCSQNGCHVASDSDPTYDNLSIYLIHSNGGKGLFFPHWEGNISRR